MEPGHYAQAQVFFARVFTIARASDDQVGEASALLDLSHGRRMSRRISTKHSIGQMPLARLRASQGFAGISQTAWETWAGPTTSSGIPKRPKDASEAERQAEKLGNIDRSARWLLDLGYIYFDRARLIAKPRQSYQQSLDLATRLKTEKTSSMPCTLLPSFPSSNRINSTMPKRYADEALTMARADGNKRDATYPRLVQGRVAAQQHDPAAAEAAFHEVAESKDSPTFLKWEAERSLARLYEDENQIDAARREYRVALSTFEAARSEVKRENSRLPFLNNATRIYDDYIQFLVKQHKSDEALQVAEYSRARTLNEGLGFLTLSKSGSDVSARPAGRAANRAAR